MNDKMKMFLETLTDDQKEALKLALNNTEEVVQETVPEPQPSQKRRGRKKTVITDISNTTTNKPQKKSRKKVVNINDIAKDDDYDDEDDDIENTTSKRRAPRKRVKKRLEGKKQCRVEALKSGSRANIFEQSDVFYSDKHLSKEDKLLWKNRNPTPRSRYGFVEVVCRRCKNTFTVSPQLARKGYVCDDCITS